MQARVINVDAKNWTVDVVTVFDQRRFFKIQVGALYLHPSRGEGFYVLPEPGCLCHVMLPGDTAPPYVTDFVAPLEVRADSDAQSTVSAGGKQKLPADASFAVGRYGARPGDMIWRGRDGNFAIMHRGGTLQLGCSALARRFFFPLGHHVLDIARTYEMQTLGGALRWSIDDEAEESPTRWSQVFRLRGADKEADVRVQVGRKVPALRDPDETDRARLGDIEFDDACYELAVSIQGFTGHDAISQETDKATVLRYAFDEAGKVSFRCESAYLSFKRDLRVRAVEQVVLEAKRLLLQLSEGIQMLSPEHVELEGKTIRFNKGGAPLARLGDPVLVAPGVLPVAGTITPPGGPPAAFVGTITVSTPLPGAITGGNPTLLG
jgi:hypothetical protein